MYKTQVVNTSMSLEEITDDEEFWYDKEKYKRDRSIKHVRLELIGQVEDENLSLKRLCAHGLKTTPQGPIKMTEELANYVDDFLYDNVFSEKLSSGQEIPSDCYEGVKYSINVNRYERSSVARNKCIEKKGCKCIVCGMDFEEMYGEIGKGFIHIHHVVPISTINKNYRVNYEKDLVPVCPNCHAMLHYGEKGKVLTVDDLKRIIDKNMQIKK